ncbi:unnamed protein product [Darwinula stevensoni]|uniref:EB domain-containing protein n=1 Tax=Darwinula stevensoni TaxID=69355 RepID=A0A7R8X3R3_9CRUS|nr:unnamed protein product [Darwinula stevensoni]CAG0882783.1 unnamed protein product [Darwinula stevensoni]
MSQGADESESWREESEVDITGEASGDRPKSFPPHTWRPVYLGSAVGDPCNETEVCEPAATMLCDLRHEAPCDEATEVYCTDPLICNRSMCICEDAKPNVLYRECYSQSGLNESCTYDGNCMHLGGSQAAICKDGRCQCNHDNGFFEADSTCAGAGQLTGAILILFACTHLPAWLS